MNFVQRKQMQVYLAKQMWHSGYKFIACYDMNTKKEGLRKLMRQNPVVRATRKVGKTTQVVQEIKTHEVIKMVIESTEIPGYAVVVLAPTMATEYINEFGDEALALDYKAEQLMRAFNLAPAKSKMTTPKPFTNYRKEVIKVMESLDEVIRMVNLA